MGQAKSHVQVTIGGKLDPSFQQSFSAADKKQSEFARHADELGKKIGDIGAYRKQQNALRESATAYTQARAKVAALKAEIAASENPTRRQQAALAAAERSATKAGSAYQQARAKLSDMARELQKNGVNLRNLSSEYRRLKGELDAALAKYKRHEDSLARQRRIVAGMHSAWMGIGKLAAGSVAAAAVLNAPTKKALSYEEQLAYMADTAGAGKSVAEKTDLQKQLSDAVENARQFSKGAKREDVATALQTLIASGQFSDQEAMALLPSVSRTAFAGQASSEDIAKTAIAMKQFGIRDVGAEFDQMLRAGQLGNFELKDMAKFLPEQLAMAKAVGYSGSAGLTELLAFNQVAMGQAGTQEAAGTNVVNLLQKLSGREFADSMAENIKPVSGDPRRKGSGKKGKMEFDWATYSMQQREKGVGAIEAFGGLLERQVAGDKRYKELQRKLATAKDDKERDATYKSMVDIIEGSILGKIIADRQAFMGALSAKYGKEKMASLKGELGPAASTIVSQSAEFLGAQNFAKANILSGNVDRANENAYGAVSGPLGSLLDGVNSLSVQFPKLTSAAYGAAIALSAIAAFGIGGAVFGRLGGGAAAGGAGAAGAAAAGAGGWMARGSALASRVAPYAKGAAMAAAGGFVVDAGAGAFGVGGNSIDQGQDDANWSRSSAWEKIQSALPRGIEKAGGLLFLDNMVNQAKSERIASETAYFEAKAASEAAGANSASNQPNVTQTFNNNIAVTVNEAKDGKALSDELGREVARVSRAQAAEARSGMVATPEN